MEVGFPHKTGNDFPGASPKIEQVARSISRFCCSAPVRRHRCYVTHGDNSEFCVHGGLWQGILCGSVSSSWRLSTTTSSSSKIPLEFYLNMFLQKCTSSSSSKSRCNFGFSVENFNPLPSTHTWHARITVRVAGCDGNAEHGAHLATRRALSHPPIGYRSRVWLPLKKFHENFLVFWPLIRGIKWNLITKLHI